MADTAITISDDRVTIFSNQEIANNGGFTHKFRVLYTDIAYGTGSTDTVTMTLGATPAKFIIDRAMINVSTAFAGTTALAVIAGTTTTTNGFIASASVLTAAVLQPSTGINTLATIASGTATAAKNMVMTFTNSTGGSPSALTAGELDLYLAIHSLPSYT